MNGEKLALSSTLVVLAVLVSGCALLVAGAVGGGAAGAAASAQQGQSAEEEHGVGAYVGAVAADILYVPAKVVFAGVGALTSGLTYLVTVGNTSASSAVWNATVEGTYVITPRHIEGKDPVRFIGP
jgi:hypothetical protein